MPEGAGTPIESFTGLAGFVEVAGLEADGALDEVPAPDEVDEAGGAVDPPPPPDDVLADDPQAAKSIATAMAAHAARIFGSERFTYCSSFRMSEFRRLQGKGVSRM